MNRISLTDESGQWFDIDSATSFEDKTFWDGSNHISKTAGQHNSHTLYRTASGKWVLGFTSQWQGTNDSYEHLSDKQAAKWFMKNEYENDEIPAELLELLADDIAELEL